MSKPRNWHEMSTEQRRQWERDDNERYDLERAAEDAKREASNAERNLRERMNELQNARDSHADEVAELEQHLAGEEAEHDATCAELNIARNSLANLVDVTKIVVEYLQKYHSVDAKPLIDDLLESVTQAKGVLDLEPGAIDE